MITIPTEDQEEPIMALPIRVGLITVLVELTLKAPELIRIGVGITVRLNNAFQVEQPDHRLDTVHHPDHEVGVLENN